jgi:HD-like signal output (HDOD) protein
MFEVNEEILEKVRRSFPIPSKPELLIALQAEFKSADPNMNRIADIISQDVGIAGGVLKVVNSSAFSLPRSVTDIKQSALFLGLSGVHSVVTTLVLKQMLSADKCCISLDSFWEKNSYVANTALFIGKQFKQYLAPEDIYTAALFQDCGIATMALKYNDYDKVLSAANNSSEYTLADIEELNYKTNHAVVGYFIASTWQLPRNICPKVLLHHDHRFLNKSEHCDEQLMFAVIKMAENIVNLHFTFRNTTDWPLLKDSILDTLCFSEDDYQDMLEDIDEQLFADI